MSYQFDRLKILVVDDNAHMRKLVSTILQAFGVSQVFEAESGERAWVVLREVNPDICVLDWVMEGMSGLDLVRKLRADPVQYLQRAMNVLGAHTRASIAIRPENILDLVREVRDPRLLHDPRSAL